MRNFLPMRTSFNTAAISHDARYICAGSCLQQGKRKRRGGGSKKKKRPRADEEEEQANNIDSSSDDDSGSGPGAYLVCWDTRHMSQPLLTLNNVHSDDINHVIFEANTSRLLSCADDSLVCLTDLTAPPDDRLIDVRHCPFVLCLLFTHLTLHRLF